MSSHKQLYGKTIKGGRLQELKKLINNSCRKKKTKEVTVEPLLTATSLQWPLYFVSADSPYIDSYLNLSTTATATKACPQLPK